MEVIDVPQQLEKVVRESGLTDESGLSLMRSFSPFFVEASALIERAAKVSVTDATQVSEMKKAREIRLALRKQRTEAENRRKALKEESLRTGKAIDNVARVISLMCEPAEEAMEKHEKFAERAEAARKAELRKARTDLLTPFGVDCSFYALEEMPEETFAQLLESSRLSHQAKIDAAAKAEADRIAAVKARAEEEARVRAENDRLRAEREEADRKAAADRRAADEKLRREREASETKLRAEREAREKAEAELKAKQDAEAKRAKAEAAAKRKAERAPDAVKLRHLAMQFADVQMPAVKSEDAKEAVRVIIGRRDALAALITELANKLEA